MIETAAAGAGGVMRDYLISIPNIPADASSIGNWAELVDGNWRLTFPLACTALPVIAYSSLGTPATTDELGEIVDPGVEPVSSPGWWAIVSLDGQATLPTEFAAHVIAEADRETGLILPDGVAGLSTLWAGMKLLDAPPEG